LAKVTSAKIRIKDIAVLASVSAGTVDRVLHNRGEVAEETRKQILEIVESMGYTPNLVAKSLALKKTYRIAALIPGERNDNPYWQKPRIGIEQAYGEIKDFNSDVDVYTFNMRSEDSFVKSFEKMLKTEPDGIIFNPVFLTSSHTVIKRCEEKHIPYIFIDINLDGCNNLAYYGQDAFRSGYLAAKLMNYSMTEGSEILILRLTHHLGSNHHLVQREKGFLDFFKEQKKKDQKLFSQEIKISDEKILANTLTRYCENGSGPKGIFVTNSRVYKVAGQLERMNITGTTLIGYDLIQENTCYLEKGIISFLIGQNPEDQGYRSIMAMFNYLLLNKPVNKINYSPIDVILKENISYYKNYNS
jgi:LacI family transcriptional regulator